MVRFADDAEGGGAWGGAKKEAHELGEAKQEATKEARVFAKPPPTRRRRGVTFKEKHHVLFGEKNHAQRDRFTVRQKNDQIKNLKTAVLEIKWGGDEGSHRRHHIRSRTMEKGEVVFEQGSVGNAMYFVNTGMLDVVVNGKRVHVLKEGDFFGEFAILHGAGRTAGIVACEDASLWVFDKHDLKSEFVTELLEAAKENGTKAEGDDPAGLRNCGKNYPAGTDIVSAGDVSEGVYYIAKGQCNVLVGNVKVNTLQSGMFFGENGMRGAGVRNATVEAYVDSMVWMLTRYTINAVLSNYSEFSTIFSYHPGAIVVKQGEMANYMFFVLEGELDVLVDDQWVDTVKKGGFFGESGLRGGLERTADVVAHTECELQVFSRHDLQHLLAQFAEHGSLEQHKTEFNTDSQIEMKTKLRGMMNKKEKEKLIIGSTRQERWANAALGEIGGVSTGGIGGVSREAGGLYTGGIYERTRNVKQEELYTIETLMQRVELIDNPDVVDALDRHWSAVAGALRRKRGGVIYKVCSSVCVVYECICVVSNMLLLYLQGRVCGAE
jgi:CRP-like cAMP-binding protein